MKQLILSCLLLLTQLSFGAIHRIDRVDPPHWWAGMESKTLQLLFYGENLTGAELQSKNPLVRVTKVHHPENPNYLIVDLALAGGVRPGSIDFDMRWKGDKQLFSYELKARKPLADRQMGLDPSDLIYLIMPDRFANADKSNDKPAGMRELHKDEHPLKLRQGGDLKGIQNHLDYIQELGATAIWLNPVLVNDQEIASYHGYAATDLYVVDPRFGGNEAYRDLIEACHEKGIKMVKDIIHNHVGNMNWLILDLPMADWIHQWPVYTKTSFRAPTLFDPHASTADRRLMLDGWFDTRMPDLNQSNPFVANHLIQNNIWWIEEFGIDAFRMDTWSYNEPSFLKDWTDAILTEYPDFGIFGETWVHGGATQAYFHGETNVDKDSNSGIPSLTDFQMHYAFEAALTQPQGWTEGVSKIYYALAKDYLYKNPEELVIFLDNHDKTRIWTTVKEDYNRYLMAIDLLMTMRGIPSLYYGTEILMGGSTHPSDALVRVPFPGGWPEHEQNKFTRKGRTEAENAAFDYVSTMAKWRTGNPAISKGKLMQFVPYDGLYVYFRYAEKTALNENNTVMVIVNTSEEVQKIDNNRFKEMTADYSKGVHPVSKETYNLEELEVPAGKSLVLELK